MITRSQADPMIYHLDTKVTVQSAGRIHVLFCAMTPSTGGFKGPMKCKCMLTCVDL